MDEPSSDRGNPNDRGPDTLFMPCSPEATTPNKDSTIEEAQDDYEDDDSSSESDGPVYSESDEFFPNCLAYDPRVEGVKARAEMSVQRLDHVLGQYATLNKDLENMKLKTAEVMKSRSPTKMRIGFLGGTAAGKSALLNSLTDVPGLAKEMSAGEACTSVPMVYTHELAGQTLPYAAKISYIPLTECRDFLASQLESYNLFTFKFNLDWDDKEKNKWFQESDTALSAFQTLFCDRTEFQTSEAAIETLAQSYRSGRSWSLLNMMVNWYTERLHEACQGQDASHAFCEGGTVAEMRAKLDPLITPTCVYDVASLWPLVKEVHVGVPSSRVLRHMTIADLPGITDTNRIRVNATHDHIRKCQALWYIVSVERACTDEDLDASIRHFADRFPGAIDVVMTKIDQGVNDGLAEQMKGKRQSLGLYGYYLGQIRQHNESLKRVRRQIRRVTSAIQREALRRQVETLEDSLAMMKSEKMKCIVEARNTYVVSRLKREKTRHLPEGAKLRVHCVSNQHYAIHKDVVPKEGPILHVNNTGIPALRSHILGLAAPAIWECHKEILVHKLKVLFHGVHGWTLTAPMQHNRGLPEVVTSAKDLWEVVSETSFKRCIQNFSAAVLDKLRAEHASSMADAMRFLAKLKSEHPLSFLAYFRRSGKHNTRAVGPRSWNEEFLRWQTNNVMSPAWDSSPIPQDSFDEGVEKLVKVLEEIPGQLENMPESVPLSITTFENVLQGQIALIHAERDRTKNKYRDKYRNIKLDASRDQHTSYFSQAMEPCYKAGKDDKGDGVCSRVQNLLTNHLTNKDPIGQATDKLEAAFQDVAGAQAHALRTGVKRILEEINQQFKLIVRVGSETPEEIEARAKVREVLAELMPGIERIELDLREVEQTYM